MPRRNCCVLEGLIPRLGEDGVCEWGRAGRRCRRARKLVFLGLLEGEPLFAAVPSEGDPDPAYTRRETWAALGVLPADELALYGGARSVLDWHARHRFCPQLRRRDRLAKGGWQRDCVDACGAQQFPRTDPVTIMLVEHVERPPAARPQRALSRAQLFRRSPGSSSPARRSRKRSRARCSRKPGCACATSATSPASRGRSPAN